MIESRQSPIFPVIASEEVDIAFRRLFDIALNEDAGGAKRVADFLLACWNGDSYGHFQIIDALYVDREISVEMLTILAFLNQNGVHYANSWGHRAAMERVIDIWR